MKILLISLLLIALTAGFVHAQSTASKQISTFNIASPDLGIKKKIWVYTPKSYKNSNKSYPVIYMFDAQNLFDAKTSYAGEWEIDEYLDSLTTKDKEAIIVGIEHGNDKRIDELTPYSHEKHGGGNGDLFLQFIIKNVKPEIDKTYRTKSSAKFTTIFGSSLGGLMALYAVIKYPETFTKAGVFSPAFWINPEINDFIKTSEILKSTKFYFMAGSAESDTMIADMKKVITLLKVKGIKDKQIKSTVIEGGEHNEKLWRDNFPDAFQWLMN
ncbi:alpha/beta hydrolase [Sediminibacter sp. Hel_I_10]|uniref:alpha/beta hydrolase n=1 Tax=Sediminibacter sp. Hel_I_10 TaxID=1392490 RepID=UPI00056B4C11|nr:alpha/beta hydrolase-fold protein [Sediminibacter sp. Hel_I_10]